MPTPLTRLAACCTTLLMPLALVSPLTAEDVFNTDIPQYTEPREEETDKDNTYYLGTTNALLTVDENDLIAWTGDGGLVDPDDLAASPLALAMFARAGMQDQLVHFSYNNNPQGTGGGQADDHHIGNQNTAAAFGYDDSGTQFFNCVENAQYHAAVDHLVDVILNETTAARQLYLINAGPHELAWRVLYKVSTIDPSKLANVTLVSHSVVNNYSAHNIRSGLLLDGIPEADLTYKNNGNRGGHNLEHCLSTNDREPGTDPDRFADVKYFFTSRQGQSQNFGSKGNNGSNGWAAIDWMRTSDCAAWNTCFESMEGLKTYEGDDVGLDASDAGIAYTLITGDPDGNFGKFTTWVDGWCPDDDDGGAGPVEPRAELAPSATSVAIGQAITFSAAGSVASDGESITEYRFYYDWIAKDFQNTTPPTNTYTHTYSEAGTYTVYLRVRDSGGLQDWSTPVTITVTGEVTGGPLPVAALDVPTSAKVGETVTFSAANSVPSSGAAADRYRFYFGNGDAQWIDAPASTTTYTYSSPGTYNVRVFMRDSEGLKDWSDFHTIIVSDNDGDGGSATLLNDTYAHKNKANDNFGTNNLRLSQNGIWVSYLKYDISDFSGAQDAVLSLYCTNPGDGNIEVYYNNTDDWDEGDMTYATRVPHDSDDKIGGIDSTYASGSYVTINLSEVPLDTDIITLILEIAGSPADSTVFHSKETASNVDQVPELEILPSGGG